MSVDCLMYRPSPAMKRKKMFLARIEWLPVTSRSHDTSQSDKSKISIMMYEHNSIMPTLSHKMVKFYVYLAMHRIKQMDDNKYEPGRN